MSALLDLDDSSAPDAGHDFLERLRQRAFSWHERGDLKPAESGYLRILERSPTDHEVRRALGVLALQTGRYAWALQLSAQVAEFHDSADVQAQMGAAYFGLSRLGDALRCYERAIAAQFDHVPARIHRARVLHAMGRGEEAAFAYARTIELGFDNAVVHTLRGVTLADLGRTEESIACFERALALDPEYLPAHVNLGTQLKKLVADAHAHKVAASAGLQPNEDQGPVRELPPRLTQTAVAPVPADTHIAELPLEESAPAKPQSPALATRDSRRPDWSVRLIGAAPTAATLVLSVLVGSELAHAAIALLAKEHPLVVPTTTAAAVRASPAGFDVQPIVDAHLFGQVQQIRDPASATPANPILKLTGTLATEDPRRGIAIIGESGKSHVYSIGESLDGASLWQVYRDHVILERDGAFESLFLPRAQSLNQAIVPPARAGIPGILEASPAMNAGTGASFGIRVVPGKDRGLFMRSGLMAGDIVVAVNGAQVDLDADGDLWKHVASGSTVSVLRRGVRKDITLTEFP